MKPAKYLADEKFQRFTTGELSPSRIKSRKVEIKQKST